MDYSRKIKMNLPKERHKSRKCVLRFIYGGKYMDFNIEAINVLLIAIINIGFLDVLPLKINDFAIWPIFALLVR